MRTTCIACVLVFAQIAAAQEIRKDPTVENVRQQISAINLVNALYLTPLQTKEYVRVLTDLKDVQAAFQEKYSELSSEMKAEYSKLYDEVRSNKGLSKPVEKSAGDVHKRELDLKDEYAAKLLDIDSKLIDILTENQLCIADEFKPCLVPPKNLRDPSRVGQAKGDTYGAVSVLEQLRKVPPKRYALVREKALGAYLDKYEKKIEVLSDDRREAEYARVGKVLDNARALSAVDFELRKESLAREILIEPELKRKKNELSKAGKILLDVRLLPILEQRLVASN